MTIEETLREQNKGLADKNREQERRIEELEKQVAAKGQAGGPSTDADDALQLLREQNVGLAQKIDEQANEIQALKDNVSHSASVGEYELNPISKGSDVYRYDSIQDPNSRRGEFAWYEAIGFSKDSCYDASAILDRAKGSIERALGGDGYWRMGGDSTSVSNLPPFNNERRLEVIVRIV